MLAKYLRCAMCTTIHRCNLVEIEIMNFTIEATLFESFFDLWIDSKNDVFAILVLSEVKKVNEVVFLLLE